MPLTAPDVRYAVVVRLQSYLSRSQPGTEEPDAYEHAISLALNPARAVVNGPFLFRNVVRDARRILRRRGRELTLSALSDGCRYRSQGATPSGGGTEAEDGGVGLRNLSHTQTPELLILAKDAELALRRRLSSADPAACACLDGLLAGESADETATRMGVPVETVQRARASVRQAARQVFGGEGA